MYDTLFEFEFGAWRFAIHIDLYNWTIGFAFDEHQCDQCDMMIFALHLPTVVISLDRLLTPEESDNDKRSDG